MSDTVKDLVCGMDVSIDSKHNVKHDDKSYYFCSEHCLEKFKLSPAEYINQDSSKKESCCSGH